ncbi:mycofactocin-coupled SDR family oxidoreductase [Nocardia cyriacigeorgica]|uniref:mycofactocin-coupled SDR family oxidoreductase n=1 Tax=Nocardia cyriacigeorgica TaxID=135487 RepID=UPI0013D47D6A|nr:mycofactocin-coupled SDR family oxidoreductase [Nocardia cyriacigeorgica]NEW27092.1 mycofactocin-coupled SDR family oxidoreductase [Nocardia cyriacigeorgica]
MGSLDGKVAFITGAARGQGRSHAVMLAEQGADIIGVDISKQVSTVPYPTAQPGDLEETVRLVEATGRRMLASDVDVRDLAGLREAVDRGVAEFGRLDIVIANAGINTAAPTIEMEEEMWNEMIDINLTGVWKTVRAAVPHIVAGGRGGSVLLISSIVTEMPNNNIAHYAAAKHGVVGLMRVLTKELGQHNIRVNSIHPTTVATDMVLNDMTYRLFRPELENPTREDFESALSAMYRLPIRIVEPVDISNAVLYLVGDTGRYVTGATHYVDAGGHL